MEEISAYILNPNVRALIIRIGLGGILYYITIIIIWNPQHPILIIEAPALYAKGSSKAFAACSLLYIRFSKLLVSTWVVVKIMVPFWVLINIIRHLIFRVPKKGA